MLDCAALKNPTIHNQTNVLIKTRSQLWGGLSIKLYCNDMNCTLLPQLLSVCCVTVPPVICRVDYFVEAIWQGAKCVFEKPSNRLPNLSDKLL